MDNTTEKEMFKKIDFFAANELKALEDFKSKGGKVAALFCKTFPVSLLSGLGVWPVRIICGATEEAEGASEQIVRPDVCSYCKTLIGNFIQKSAIHKHVDFIVGLITCDQMRRTLERLSTDLDLPVFPVQLPSTNSTQAEDYFILGIQNAMDNIAGYLGNTIDFNIVREQEQLRVESAKIVSDLMWKGSVSPLIMHRISHLFTWSRPLQFLEFIKDISPAISTYTPRFSLITIGSALCEEDDTMARIVLERNIGLIPLHCTGLTMVDGMQSIENIADKEVLPALSRIYFRMPACIRTRPNTGVFDRIRETLQRTGAKGIILKTLTFCDLWYTEKERIKKSFGVPVLVYNAGYGEGESERIKTRLETFLDTVV